MFLEKNKYFDDHLDFAYSGFDTHCKQALKLFTHLEKISRFLTPIKLKKTLFF